MTTTTMPTETPPGRHVSATKPKFRFRRAWSIGLLSLGALLLWTGCGEQPATDEASQPADEPEVAAESEPTPETQGVEEGEPEEAAEPEPDAQTDESAAYEVISVDDTGLGRIDARIVVAGEPDQETLIATAETVVLDLREDSPYTGAFVFLYAEHDPTDDTYTLARAIDAPRGDIANAADARPGEYSEHIIVIDAREKDWAEQPSARDAAIHTDWIALNDELWDEVDLEELDEETDRRLAERLGMQPEDVAAAVDRVSSWLFSGEQTTVRR